MRVMTWNDRMGKTGTVEIDGQSVSITQDGVVVIETMTLQEYEKKCEDESLKQGGR